MAETLDRKAYDSRIEQLKADRLPWESVWKDVGDYLLPQAVKFDLSDTQKGKRRDSKIINSYATQALHILDAGMTAGITSAARPWHTMTVPQPALMDRQSVKSWLYDTVVRQRLVFAQSNLYTALSVLYREGAAFGTAVMIVEEDTDDVVRAFNLPMGTYYLATDHRGVVNTVARELRMTVVQVVKKFGLAACSSMVQSQFKNGNYTTPVDVCHLIEPRDERDPRMSDSMNKPFRSVWWEKNSSDPAFLRVGGYDEFPAVIFRWDVSGNDVYGWGPGQTALGDIKALQTLERRKAQLVDKIANPPMRGPSSLRNQRSSLLPGDMTYLDSSATGVTFEPVMKVEPQAVAAVGEEIERHIRRIGEVFLVNMWLMMANSDRREITAREVDERHEEKMLQIGPTLERLHDEVLDPLIDRVFGIMLRRGLLPPIPKELQGQTLKVEYTSIMAQAQKVLSTSSIDRLTTFVLNTAAVVPGALDTLDVDDVIKTYAENLGVKPSLVRPADAIKALRAARQQAQAQQAALQQTLDAATAAQRLARAPTDGQNALTEMMRNTGSPVMAEAVN